MQGFVEPSSFRHWKRIYRKEYQQQTKYSVYTITCTKLWGGYYYETPKLRANWGLRNDIKPFTQDEMSSFNQS